MHPRRLWRRRSGQAAPDDVRSLFVVSLPRSLSSLLYVAAARSIGLVEPVWTSDGEILNRDRVPRRLQSHAPADERFTLLGSSPGAFAAMTAPSRAPPSAAATRTRTSCNRSSSPAGRG